MLDLKVMNLLKKDKKVSKDWLLKNGEKDFVIKVKNIEKRSEKQLSR